MRQAVLVLLAASSAFAAEPNYLRDVEPVFAENCSGCHLSKVKMGGLNLENYDGLMQGGSTGKVIVPGDSKSSRLYLMITGKMMPSMPMNSKRLPEDKIEIIRQWIDAGAKGPAPGETAPSTTATALPHIEPRSSLKPQIFDLSYS